MINDIDEENDLPKSDEEIEEKIKIKRNYSLTATKNNTNNKKPKNFNSEKEYSIKDLMDLIIKEKQESAIAANLVMMKHEEDMKKILTKQEQTEKKKPAGRKRKTIQSAFD